MAASIGTSVTSAVRAPPPSYYDAVNCKQEDNNKTSSKSLELVTYPKDKCQLYPVFFSNRNGTDIRLPPALYYHRNSDPLLHRRSQTCSEEFGEFCHSAKTKRRQSVKEFFRNNSKSEFYKHCILNHSSSSLLPKNNTLPICNGGVKSFKRNGTILSNTLDSSAKLCRNNEVINGPNSFDFDILDSSTKGACTNSVLVETEQPAPKGISGSSSDLCLVRTDHCSYAISHEESEDVLLNLDEKDLDEELVSIGTKDKTIDTDPKHEGVNSETKEMLNSSDLDEICTTSELENVIIKIDNDSTEYRQHSEIDQKDIRTDFSSFDETEIKNVDLQPRVLCNGALITSTSDQDLNASESQPFLLRNDSVSGSDSNCSVKHNVNWQRPRPLSSLSNCSGDNTGSLPGSLERHSHVARHDSGTGSESNCSVKPSLSWNKNRPISALSSRSCSPQPGPSGYNGLKDKRSAGKKTVTYSDTVGNFTTVASYDSSHSINYRSTVGEESLRRLDDEIEEIERVGKKADRGTIYCACGILGIIIGVVLIFVYFI